MDGGDHAFLTDIACFMGDQPIAPEAPPVHWLNVEETVRRRWRSLVTARRDG
jgi:hypothetical protein